MKKIAVICLLLLSINGVVYAGQLSKIELTDGTVIEAEIVSLQNGFYTINTKALGRIAVAATKIRKIEALDTINAPVANISDLSNTAFKSEMDRVKTNITNNPEIMQTIAGLMVDPQFQELLKDPSIVKAVNSGDMKALIANDKFMSVINHPKLKEIENKLQGQGR